MPPLGVITGTRQEAACLAVLVRRGAVVVAETAGAPAAQVAERLIGIGCTALVSFGTAGGLDPALAPGALIVADALLRPEGTTLAPDPSWSAAVSQAMTRAGIAHRRGALFSAAAPLATAGDKALVFMQTRALAVDMESHAVAIAAGRAERPWIALRAVADPAGRGLPRAVVAAFGREGGFRLDTVFGALLRHPGDIRDFVRFAGAGRRALAGLRRVAAAGVLGEPL